MHLFKFQSYLLRQLAHRILKTKTEIWKTNERKYVLDYPVFYLKQIRNVAW